MKMSSSKLLVSILAVVLLASVLFMNPTASTTVSRSVDAIAIPTATAGGYNPWADFNNDGKLNIMDVSPIAAGWQTTGTPLTKAYVAYDSGWIDITDKCGQTYTVVHNLNSMDVMVDLTGKPRDDTPPHQIHLGLTGYTPAWIRTFIGNEGQSLIQTTDGGYAIAGTATPGPTPDFCLVKTDATGYLLWNKTYNGGEGDWTPSLIQTSDGGYAMAGFTTVGAPPNMNLNMWLVKTDADGNYQFDVDYGGSKDDGAYSLIQTSDGGYAMAGSYKSLEYSGAYLVKMLGNGGLMWSQLYGGSGDYATSLIQTSDGGYAMVCHDASLNSQAYLIKTDANGIQTLKVPYAANSELNSLMQTIEGGYVLAGSIRYPDQSYDAYIIKTNSNGVTEWSKTYGIPGVSEQAYSVIQTYPDRGYAWAGSKFYQNRIDAFCFVKTDTSGNTQWERLYKGALSGSDYPITYAKSLIMTIDGGFAMAGTAMFSQTSEQRICLIKVDYEDGLCWAYGTLDSIQLYRGETDLHWNYVRVKIWAIEETP